MGEAAVEEQADEAAESSSALDEERCGDDLAEEAIGTMLDTLGLAMHLTNSLSVRFVSCCT